MPVTVKCEWCGKDFQVKPSELNGESDFAVMSAALLHGKDPAS